MIPPCSTIPVKESSTGYFVALPVCLFILYLLMKHPVTYRLTHPFTTAYLILLLDLANFRKLGRLEAKRSQLSGDFHNISTYPIITFGRL